MKRALIFLIGLTLIHTLDARTPNAYTTTKFIEGCPEKLAFIRDQIHLSDMSYTFLKTGIDSMQVMFGELTQNGKKGYWISLFENGSLKNWTTIPLKKELKTNLSSNVIDIKYDNSQKVISVQIMYDASTKSIRYTWMRDKKMSSKAYVKTIENDLQQGKKFPKLKVEKLNGDTINLMDLKGKTVVINWWNIGCGPCRGEMPGLNTLVDKYKNNSGIVFLAVALDDKAKLMSFLKSKEFKYIQTVGNDKALQLFGNTFPKHLIINTEGVISYFKEGGSEDFYMYLDKELTKLIE